jgi:hypothetical protein
LIASRTRAVPLVGLVSLALVVSACAGQTAQGGLEVTITTAGLQLGTDFDAIEGVVMQETSPGQWHKLFDVAQYVPQPISLPTTLAIRAGTDPDQDALIEVSALKNGAPVVERVVQTQVPTDRVTQLAIVLSADCLGKVAACPAGESCQPDTGQCGPNTRLLAAGAEAALGADAGFGGEADATTNVEATIEPEGGDTEAGVDSGCRKPWTHPTGSWVEVAGPQTPIVVNGKTIQHPGALQPLASIVGPDDTELRGYWVLVPNNYDPTKEYRVIYDTSTCGAVDIYSAGADGYPYQSVDGDQAILVGLDYDTTSVEPDDYDTQNPKSNDLAFMPWLMNEVESTFCVDTKNEWVSSYTSCDPSIAQQFDCAFPAKLRGQVIVGGIEPGAAGVAHAGSLPPCSPAPMAAFFVHDFNDPDMPYAGILPGCSRILAQNGCSNTKCDPLDPALTTPYPIPAGVTLPEGAVCNQFVGCPAADPVVFCVTANQGESDGQRWGVLPLFWSFIENN